MVLWIRVAQFWTFFEFQFGPLGKSCVYMQIRKAWNIFDVGWFFSHAPRRWSCKILVRKMTKCIGGPIHRKIVVANWPLYHSFLSCLNLYLIVDFFEIRILSPCARTYKIRFFAIKGSKLKKITKNIKLPLIGTALVFIYNSICKASTNVKKSKKTLFYSHALLRQTLWF